MKGVGVGTLGFKMTEKVLHTGIVSAVSPYGYTGLHTVSLKQAVVLAGSILKSLVAVQKNFLGIPPLPIEYQLGDICYPHLVRLICFKLIVQMIHWLD